MVDIKDGEEYKKLTDSWGENSQDTDGWRG